MSRWRAYAEAREVSDADLRERYVDALETLHVVADKLRGAHDEVKCYGANERSLLDAIETLAGLATDRDAELTELAERAEKAEERLEPSLQRIADLEDKVATLQRNVDELTAEAIARQPMLDAYADLLARARAFVTFAEKSGVRVRHCRPANENGGKRKKG